MGSRRPSVPIRADPPRELDWSAFIRELGRRHRRLREFVGLSQDQLARLAGVSQGAVSRLETGRGLATPLLIVMKIAAALVRELRGIDTDLLDRELREAADLDAALLGFGVASPPDSEQLEAAARLEDLIRLYHETPELHRASVLSVVRALVAGWKSTALILLAVCTIAF
jgi:transcriptional regulator with XRE-family HTH domain